MQFSSLEDISDFAAEIPDTVTMPPIEAVFLRKNDLRLKGVLFCGMG